YHVSCVFFFQAEDGIRDGHVTGVQTCALPIYGSLFPVTSKDLPENGREGSSNFFGRGNKNDSDASHPKRTYERKPNLFVRSRNRSEERRVGKECISRWWRGCVEKN